jgi:hypothetical protein
MTSTEELYEMLLNQYKLVRERTEALSNRAHALLGFSGIINTILVALIMGVLKEETRSFIIKYTNSLLLQVVVILSFIFYVASMIFSLLAYKTTRYMPVPQIDSKEFVEEVFSGKTELSKKHICLQIVDAIKFHNEINSKKYMHLLLGTLFLLLAISLTAVAGIILFLLIR